MEEEREYPKTDEEFLEYVRRYLQNLTPQKHFTIKTNTPQIIADSAGHLANTPHAPEEIDNREKLISQILAVIKRESTLCMQAKVVAVTTACDIYLSVVLAELIKEAVESPEARIITLPSFPDNKEELPN